MTHEQKEISSRKLDKESLVYDIQFSDETRFQDKMMGIKKPEDESELNLK